MLFYLEGKSGAEAAAALGISEAALRVRLHRARAALRERLEETRRLAAETPPGQIARAGRHGGGAGFLFGESRDRRRNAGGGCRRKSARPAREDIHFFLAWPVVFRLIGALPGVAFAWWVGGVERRNYREPDGFRARMHRDFFRSSLWGYLLLIGSVYGIRWLCRPQPGGLKACTFF